jgi:hypothetical protein
MDPAERAPERAPGPWLLTVGMHRSGTSAVTGALTALGFGAPRADDRIQWTESNPEHWESLSLTLFDDDLLTQLGGSWDAPPDLEDGWEDRIDARDGETAVRLLVAAFEGQGPFVWKDPRICLLLPFWRRVLEPPLAAILIWRDPAAVADSLWRRDGIDRPIGLALWERYNRAALRALEGIDTYIVRYEDLTEDPESGLNSLAGWLDTLPGFSGFVPAAATSPAAAMLHAGSGAKSELDGELLLDGQVTLERRLRELHGGHRSLPGIDCGWESPWSSALLRSRKTYRSRQLDIEEQRHADELAGVQSVAQAAADLADHWRRTAENMEASMSWRVTRPLRAVGSMKRTGAVGGVAGQDGTVG